MTYEQSLQYLLGENADPAKSDRLLELFVKRRFDHPNVTNENIADLVTAYSVGKPTGYDNGFDYVLSLIDPPASDG